jgi:glycosyltransferase involved in cell wall biosynthesis
VQKILLSSNDHVGKEMAGPGIRYYNLALGLSERFDVTLKVPNDPDGGHFPNIDLIQTSDNRYRQWLELLPEFDAVIAQGGIEVPLMPYLSRTRVRAIYDLYVPFSERLAFHAGEDRVHASHARRAFEASSTRERIMLLCGDAFLCASERQRGMLLGKLHAHGRIGIDLYRADPTLSTFVATIPFGVPTSRPVKRRPALRGVVPGIGQDDSLLLWAGAIWDWTDPLTLIEAVARLARQRNDVRLYFLGLRHPNASTPTMKMTSRAIALADTLGITDTHVFFNDGWVPYDQRGDYLLEADLGVSLHFDNVETEFAYRTRLLDYIWAELPMVTSEGDALADLVESRGLGRTVAPGDVEGCANVILELLSNREEAARVRERIAAVRGELTWSRAVQPLLRLLESPLSERRPATARAVREAARYAYLRARLRYDRATSARQH